MLDVHDGWSAFSGSTWNRTRSIFNLDATYLNDALTALAIQDRDVPRLLELALQEVTEILRVPGRSAPQFRLPSVGRHHEDGTSARDAAGTP